VGPLAAKLKDECSSTVSDVILTQQSLPSRIEEIHILFQVSKKTREIGGEEKERN